MPTERTRLETEARESQKYLANLSARLGNEQFTAKAPVEVVERERERLEEGKARLDRIQELLEDLSG